MPDEIIYHILIFVPMKSWLPVLLTSKRFYFIGRKVFDPAVNDNEIFIRVCKKGALNSIVELLKDRRVNPAARNNAGITQLWSDLTYQHCNLLVYSTILTLCNCCFKILELIHQVGYHDF